MLVEAADLAWRQSGLPQSPTDWAGRCSHPKFSWAPAATCAASRGGVTPRCSPGSYRRIHQFPTSCLPRAVAAPFPEPTLHRCHRREEGGRNLRRTRAPQQPPQQAQGGRHRGHGRRQRAIHQEFGRRFCVPGALVDFRKRSHEWGFVLRGSQGNWNGPVRRNLSAMSGRHRIHSTVCSTTRSRTISRSSGLPILVLGRAGPLDLRASNRQHTDHSVFIWPAVFGKLQSFVEPTHGVEKPLLVRAALFRTAVIDERAKANVGPNCDRQAPPRISWSLLGRGCQSAHGEAGRVRRPPQINHVRHTRRSIPGFPLGSRA